MFLVVGCLSLFFFFFGFYVKLETKEKHILIWSKETKDTEEKKKEELSYWDKNKKEKKQTNCFISTNDFAYAMN
jgi:hypothetical protein